MGVGGGAGTFDMDGIVRGGQKDEQERGGDEERKATKPVEQTLGTKPAT